MSVLGTLSRWKDDNPFLKYLWLQTFYRRQWKQRAAMSDVDCINALYKSYCGHLPDIEHPQKFSEKMQWLKLHYRNELMTVVGDKYAVRQYLEKQGYGYLLNELIDVYDSVEQFDLFKLPRQFVLKASHSSGWNILVKDKDKMSWGILKRHMQYWLTHDIAWNGREWHYGMMKPRIVCEKYLEDESGGLRDYKFYCFNGQPRFMQLNVDRGLSTSTQNYYDLDWKLLPFGKSQPHNPNIHPERPAHFDEMVHLAAELSKPFPYVRMDFYEANSRVFFGEFTFFPCSGMPDFIPQEWDDTVGKMLELPQATLKKQ